ncbi:hypothetical protein HZ326_2374 [Fusarium oxysporum f. sp. albedinis]|nr:hypothetical protein HZ326_2374 [Fusarium oxysporum f. sp. albedinis]
MSCLSGIQQHLPIRVLFSLVHLAVATAIVTVPSPSAEAWMYNLTPLLMRISRSSGDFLGYIPTGYNKQLCWQ